VPVFSQINGYEFSVAEGRPVGTTVGRIEVGEEMLVVGGSGRTLDRGGGERVLGVKWNNVSYEIAESETEDQMIARDMFQ